MKMELIGDNQIKIELTKDDLEERNMKLTELAYGGEKARQLFREIMEVAYEEHGFDVDNVPIMVEAMPLSLEKISILVTKVTDPEELEDKLNKMPAEQVIRDKRETSFSELKKKILEAKKEKYDKIEEKYRDDSIIIFSFDNLDTVSFASKRILNYNFSKSVLILNNQKYFLTLDFKDELNEEIKTISDILYEYGDKHISNEESKSFLLEHGEIIIKKDAIKVLSSMNWIN